MTAAPATLSYVLITPARNEAALIEQTLRAVVKQTSPPLRWVVVSDGSTDGTDAIVESYARAHAWIELLRLETGSGRSFARKARAFAAGQERLRGLPYDLIGNLDADVSCDEDHFAFLLERFAESPDLGVAGTPLLEGGVAYDYRFTSIHHVHGACQLFRRQCFEEIGGYPAVEGGGLDWIAVTTARMMGWQTRTFVEKTAIHHRPMGSAMAEPPWKICFRRGEKDYALGFHPLWEIARSAYQMRFRPRVISGAMLLSGYTYASLKGAPRPVSDELVRFNRAEQMLRLRAAARRLLPWRARAADGSETTTASPSESMAALQQWVESHDYKGYEPFDGLASPLRPLTLGNQRLEQVMLQIGRRSPINLRPLLGIKPLDSTKGRGYMAWGYLARFEETGVEGYKEKATRCLEWLIRNKSPLHADYSWGNHFDYASREGRIPKHEPTIVWTALIGQAFLDAYEILGDARYLEVAESICRWILKLPRERTGTGTCLSYLALRQSSIHNSNLLGAAVLARTARHSGNPELVDVARAAIEYSCTRQLPDGAWYYGEDPIYHWIDCFHTGYNLDGLKCYIDSSGDDAFRPQLELGFRYFKKTFFAPGGRPLYYHDRANPIDIQCASQAIETLAKFSDDDPEALSMAANVARWTVRNMQDAGGWFHYRRYAFARARIPMIHWGQASMYRALALLSLKQKRRGLA